MRKSKFRRFMDTLFSRKIVMVSFVVVLVFLVMAVLAPLLAPYDPYEQDLMHTLQGISSEHLFGTDKYGRDILSRIIYGSRISLIVGVGSVLIAFVIGSTIGMIIGYFGGWLDTVVMRITDMMFAIPQVVLALALAAVLGNGLWNLTFLLSVGAIPGYIRMLRGQVMAIKEQDFITAGRVIGASPGRLMFFHMLPNGFSPILVFMTQSVGGTILGEAGLSFLGLGIDPPTATWGGLINEGRQYLLTNPVYSIAPGIFIVLLVMALNILGDGIRDAMDPRLRGQH